MIVSIKYDEVWGDGYEVSPGKRFDDFTATWVCVRAINRLLREAGIKPPKGEDVLTVDLRAFPVKKK